MYSGPGFHPRLPLPSATSDAGFPPGTDQWHVVLFQKWHLDHLQLLKAEKLQFS